MKIILKQNSPNPKEKKKKCGARGEIEACIYESYVRIFLILQFLQNN